MDNSSLRHAVSCVVRVNDMVSAPLPDLEEGQAVAIQDSVDLMFIDQFTGKKCMIKRMQIPISPAFAMTAHKSQGRTLSNAIIDIASCTGTEAPYVMASHLKSLDGLLVLRWFPKNKIQVRPSEDLRLENTHLQVQGEQTNLVYGTDLEKLEARKFLNSLGKDGPAHRDAVMVGVEPSESEELNLSSTHLHNLQKETDQWHAVARFRSGPQGALNTGLSSNRKRKRTESKESNIHAPVRSNEKLHSKKHCKVH